MTKVYEKWPGSNKFCCWGLFIFGPDIRSLVASVFLISVPSILFCIFVAYQFIGKIPYGVIILPVTVAFTIWDLFILFFTAARDPGIVPRNKVPPEPDPGAPPPQPGQRKLPRTKDVVINGKTVKVKYCDTCLLYRPPRCSHCSICNNCVERFDHHCPWVGQCIGRRNYRYFFIFVTSTTLLCIFVFSMTAYYIKVLMDNAYTPNGQGRTVWQALGAAPMSVVLMAYTFVMVWFVGGLTAFHVYLMSTNQTTYENFRYRYDRKANPYNRGIFLNIYEILFSPIPLSRNKFRADAVDADVDVEQPVPSVAAEAASTRVEPELSAAMPPVKLKRPGSRGSSGGRSPAQGDYELVEVTKLREDEGGAIAESIVERGVSPSSSKSPKMNGPSGESKKKKKSSSKRREDGEDKPKRKSKKKAHATAQVQGDGWEVSGPNMPEDVDLEEGRDRKNRARHDEFGRVQRDAQAV